MQLTNSVAMVVGGASGLGAATVRHLLAQGASVAIADINAEGGAALAQELGPDTVFYPANVSDETSVQQAIRQTVAAYGALHIVVNCAGIAPPGRVLGRSGPLPLATFRQVVEVNLIGSFNVLRLAAAAMQGNAPDEQGERGVIINTASIAAYEGQIGQVAYAASKGGIVGLTLPAARDLAREGIRVMTIAPGIFDTPLLAGLPEPARQSLGAQVPFPSRLGRPQEYALLVQQIVENPMLNGSVIRLDGALRMGPR
ncbi:MAG: 3-hydroxyacyl-CoA dehydrogenase [Chloroflexi bacterium]|nr:3-hydroxyacyl-CoA dehydrogenase [Chloroflexota bacterium]